ncbi:MAG: VanZ family protein [Bacteroidota bacterium]|nr:VanZ family protein [Ferruginibacter sp.]
MKGLEIKKFIPGIAWFFVVLVLLCMPGSDVPGASWLDKIFFDKWVHTGIFALLAFLFMLPVGLSSLPDREKLQYFIRIAIATSLWGITTEFIQKYLVISRSFDLLDWAADSFGAMLAFLFSRKKYTGI